MTYSKRKMCDMQEFAQIAQALADETRLRLLSILLADDAAVSDLVTRLELPQPRVSTHLALLRQVGLVTVEVAGRQRVYRAQEAWVRQLFAALGAGVSTPARRSPQAAREVRRNTTLRQSRTCYDHLAGVAGVRLLEGMLRCGWIEPDTRVPSERLYYQLTPPGTQALEARGVAVTQAYKGRRRFAYGCLDWTERRAHLGGALGAAVLEALSAAGVVRRQPQTRAVVLLHPVAHWLHTTSTP